MSLPATTTHATLDGPLVASVACDIDRQMQGLTEMQALMQLSLIIQTKSDRISEADVRIAYAFKTVCVDNLWKNSSVIWRSGCQA